MEKGGATPPKRMTAEEVRVVTRLLEKILEAFGKLAVSDELGWTSAVSESRRVSRCS